jgi:hypothetical protein
MYTLERLDNMNEYQTYETAYKGNELFKTKKEEELEEKIKSELEVKLKKELEEKIKGDLESKNKENENLENYKPDSVVSSVMNKFLERAKIGKKKYGTDLDRTDLSLYDWIVHAQDEHMDAILYLEKIKQLIVKK